MSNQNTEQRNLAELKAHSLQRYFPPLPDRQLETLATTAENAPPAPPQILPDGIVITGCEWADAMIHKGDEDIEVIVRHDLVDNEAEAEKLFLLDKMANRALSDLRLAWCLLRMKELNHGQTFSEYVPTGTRRRIQQELHDRRCIEPRTANRLLQIARTPVSVQMAREYEEIDVKLACKVEGLPPETQHQIDKEIGEHGLDHAREIIESHVAGESAASGTQADNSRKLLRIVDRVVTEFCGHENNLHIGGRHLDTLQQVSEFFGNLYRRTQASQAQHEQVMAGLMSEFNQSRPSR